MSPVFSGPPTRRGAAGLTLFLSCLGMACTGQVGTTPSLLDARASLGRDMPEAWVAGADLEGAQGETTQDQATQTDATPAEAAQAPQPWWKEFGDQNLDALIDEALASNHDLAAAAARVDLAAAQARIQGADLYPALRLGGDASRARQVFVGLPIPQQNGSSDVLATTTNQFGLSLDLSWEIDLWGRLRAADAAAAAEAEAARILYDGARLSLAAQTAKVWFALAEAADQVALAESTLESYRAGAEQIRARYERGVRTPLDLRLALTEVAAAEARLAERRSLLERSARQLEVLLGRYPSAELAARRDDGPGALADSMPPEVPAGVPARLLSRRPDLAAAAHRVYASDQQVHSARAALLPRIALTGRAGTVSQDVSDLLDGDFGVWTIASNIVQPIFEGGRLRAAVAGAKAEAAQAEADYATTALRAFAEVENALADERHVAAVVQALDAAAEQSAAAERLAGQRYRGGLETYVTVLAAQRSALAARSTLLAARRRRLENRIDLHLALGGGFFDPASEPVEPAAATATSSPGATAASSAASAPGAPAQPEQEEAS